MAVPSWDRRAVKYSVGPLTLIEGRLNVSPLAIGNANLWTSGFMLRHSLLRFESTSFPGLDDERLKWSSDRKTVRVLTPAFIIGKFKQTEQARRKRFRLTLEKDLAAVGWKAVRRDVFAHTE